MDPIWLLLLLPAAAASGWIAANAPKFPWQKRNKIPSVYLQGINYLLNEQHDKAIELFVDKLEVDSETIEIHLSLGNLYRRRGEIENATFIHEKLIDRSDLSEDQKVQAFFELGHDFYTAGILDRAEIIFSDLAENDKYKEQALTILRDIYEQEREWQNCIRVTTKLNRLSNNHFAPLLAQYYCELAEEAIQKGRYNDSEQHLAESIRVDSNCVRAILQSGRVKAIRGQHEKAIAIWRKLEKISPEHVPETVNLVTESYLAINQSDELADFLRETAEAATDPQLAVAYVDALDSRNEIEKAEEFLLSWIRKESSIHCMHRLILLILKKNGNSSHSNDFKLVENLIRQEIEVGRSYECRNCGYTVKSLYWQCPGCKGWGTIASVQSKLPPKQALPYKAEG